MIPLICFDIFSPLPEWGMLRRSRRVLIFLREIQAIDVMRGRCAGDK